MVTIVLPSVSGVRKQVLVGGAAVRFATPAGGHVLALLRGAEVSAAVLTGDEGGGDNVLYALSRLDGARAATNVLRVRDAAAANAAVACALEHLAASGWIVGVMEPAQ